MGACFSFPGLAFHSALYNAVLCSHVSFFVADCGIPSFNGQVRLSSCQVRQPPLRVSGWYWTNHCKPGRYQKCSTIVNCHWPLDRRPSYFELSDTRSRLSRTEETASVLQEQMIWRLLASHLGKYAPHLPSKYAYEQIRRLPQESETRFLAKTRQMLVQAGVHEF